VFVVLLEAVYEFISTTCPFILAENVFKDAVDSCILAICAAIEAVKV
jgi:hypothetical protein